MFAEIVFIIKGIRPYPVVVADKILSVSGIRIVLCMLILYKRIGISIVCIDGTTKTAS